MADKSTDHLTDKHRQIIAKQRMFFVASAPLAAEGHVNLSPKGLDTFRILDDKRVCYLDFVGSGAETIAHTRENGRLTLMFCAFDGPPAIVRLWGQGRAVLPSEDEFSTLRDLFGEQPKSVRAVIVLEISRADKSCGYGVPLYRYEGERDQIAKWADKKGPDGVAKYLHDNNAVSLDGLPAVDRT